MDYCLCRSDDVRLLRAQAQTGLGVSTDCFASFHFARNGLRLNSGTSGSIKVYVIANEA